MQLEPGEQYAVWMLPGIRVDADVPEDDSLIVEGVRSVRRLTMNFDEYWIQWLGTLEIDELRSNGIGLYVTGRTGERDTPDTVRNRLLARARHLFNALFLQGSATFSRGAMLTGEQADGRVAIRYRESIDRHLWTGGKWFVPNLEMLRRTVRLAAVLDQIFTVPDALVAWRRLRGAVLAVLEGNKMSNSEGERFHQFVRALDALAKTGPQKRKSAFAHRMLTFACPKEVSRQLLLEMYDLRGQIEHFNSPLVREDETLEALDQPTKDQRRERVNRMTRQADTLVRTAICQILESEALLACFRTDQDIEAFWKLPDDQRRGLCGRSLDLTMIA
jgi:hypothetical protein